MGIFDFLFSKYKIKQDYTGFSVIPPISNNLLPPSKMPSQGKKVPRKPNFKPRMHPEAHWVRKKRKYQQF